MSNIKITCDSTCDLPQEIYAKYDVEVISLSVTLGDDLHRDGVDITAPELFAYVKETNTLPKTSAISMGEYLDVFSKYTQEGRTIIHINLSSNLSASHQNALLAAQELEGVYVVDSRNLSTGSGHLVIEAAEMAAQGLDAKTIVARLNEMKERLDVSFVLDTLFYLHKGGRCSGVAALGANVLKLHPAISMKDGKLEVYKKYRGAMSNVYKQYAREALAGKELANKNVFLVNSGKVSDEALKPVAEVIREIVPEAEIHICRAGCTISSHCGPGTVGVIFLRK